MAKYYIYDFSDYGGLKSIELTEEEARELKADDVWLFESKKQAVKFLKKQGYEINDSKD